MLKNLNIMITTGATREQIDPVRFISNYSSGKMGFALANAAISLGARVTIIAANYSAEARQILTQEPALFLKVTNSQEMLSTIEQHILTQHIFISCAAVSDYVVKQPYSHKIKKPIMNINNSQAGLPKQPPNLTLQLQPSTDIIATIAHKYPNLFIVGFAAETDNLINNAKLKLVHKNLNMIIANNISEPDSGFDSNYNHVFVISHNKNDNSFSITELAKAEKTVIAQQILQLIAAFTT